MPYFQNDIWLVGELKLPQYRINGEVVKLVFTNISNIYNKKALKQFLYSQINTTRLTFNTIYEKYRIISLFLVWLGDKDLDKITFIDAEKYAFLLDNRNNSFSTYNQYISPLREFYDYLIIRGYPVENYFENIDYKKTKYDYKLRETDHEAMFVIFSHLHTLSLKMQIMFFLVHGGMKSSYMQRIERDCLLNDNGIYKLRFYNMSAREYDYTLIPLNLYLMIEKYLMGIPETDTSKYLFPNLKDPHRHASGYALNKSIKKLLNNNGYQGKFKLSSLKNNLMIRLFSMGVTISVIKDVFKNISFATIQTYHELYTNGRFKTLIEHMNSEAESRRPVNNNNIK